MIFLATGRSPVAPTCMTKQLLACALVVTAACGGKKSEPPPAKPATGAPVAFVVDKVTPGEDHKGALDVRAYNFSDKRVAQYSILMRYHDKAGAVIKVKVGTPFEKDVDFWSFSGRRYVCEPKSWCSYRLDDLDIPANAATAEVLLDRAYALQSDGMHFEDASLFELHSMNEWPKGL